MAIKLGNTDINKIYLGTTQINKAYLGSTLIFGEESASSSSSWKLTRQTNGEVVTEFDISPENLPINLMTDEGAGLSIEITELANDGNSFVVKGFLGGSQLTVETVTQDKPSEYTNVIAYDIILQEPYHIVTNDRR